MNSDNRPQDGAATSTDAMMPVVDKLFEDDAKKREQREFILHPSGMGNALMEAAILASASRGRWGDKSVAGGGGRRPGQIKRKQARAARKKSKRHKKRGR